MKRNSFITGNASSHGGPYPFNRYQSALSDRRSGAKRPLARFAPSWLLCAVCAVAVLQLPLLIALFAFGYSPAYSLLIIPASVYCFAWSFTAIITGTTPRLIPTAVIDLVKWRATMRLNSRNPSKK